MMEQKKLWLKRSGFTEPDRLGLRTTEDGQWLELWAFVSADYWEIFEITQQDNILWAWRLAGDGATLRPGNKWSDIVGYAALPRHVSEAAPADGIALSGSEETQDDPEDILTALHRLGWRKAAWRADHEHIRVPPYDLARADAAKLIVHCLTYNKNAVNFPAEDIREYASAGPFAQ